MRAAFSRSSTIASARKSRRRVWAFRCFARDPRCLSTSESRPKVMAKMAAETTATPRTQATTTMTTNTTIPFPLQVASVGRHPLSTQREGGLYPAPFSAAILGCNGI